MNFAWLLSKDKSARFLKKAGTGTSLPPPSSPDPPQGTSSEVSQRREKMPACLPHPGHATSYSCVYFK